MSGMLCAAELRPIFVAKPDNICPLQKAIDRNFGADGWDRTSDNGVTNAVLYQLSYASIGGGEAHHRIQPTPP